MSDSLTLFLTDGVLLGCSASAVSSFLPVPRLGLINLEGYIAFSLYPHSRLYLATTAVFVSVARKKLRWV
jgi:hypothetical protein